MEDRPLAHDLLQDYPKPCPRCAKVEGGPVNVSIRKGHPGQLSIGMRCLACRHEWRFIAVEYLEEDAI